GWLGGGRKRGSDLHFQNGATWRLSFADPALAQRIQAGILTDPEVAFGMRVYEVGVQLPPRFSATYRFEVDGPVLARVNRDDGTREHLAWSDERADVALTRTLRRKLEAAGFSGEHLETRLAFDRSYA